MTFTDFQTPTPGVAVTANQTGLLLSWSFNNPLPVGNYILPYQASISSQAQSGIPLINQSWVTIAGGSPVSASCPVTVIGLFTVQVNIYNSAGEVVKTILVQNVSQPISNITLSTSNLITTLQGPGSTILIYYNGVLIGTWDGSNNSGNPVTNGTYQIKVSSTSTSGVVTSVSQQAMVNRQLSNITASIYNSSGELVRTLYNLVSDSFNSQMTNVNLSSSVISPGPSASGTGANLQIIVVTSGAPVTLTWDGTNNSATVVTPGSYTIQLNWDNGQGATTDISRTVLVTPPSGSTGVAMARPNVLEPSQTMTTTFDGSGVTNAYTVNARVYTISGQLITSIQGTPGAASALWNASGMASGIYFAVVDVLNANGGNIDHQTFKLLVLH
jgi:flagellar hook assembly protein FlgD